MPTETVSMPALNPILVIELMLVYQQHSQQVMKIMNSRHNIQLMYNMHLSSLTVQAILKVQDKRAVA